MYQVETDENRQEIQPWEVGTVSETTGTDLQFCHRAVTTPPSQIVFVSTALDVIRVSNDRTTDDGDRLPERLINGQVYRQLDSNFYAWFRFMMDGAARATDAGKMSTATYDELLGKFDPIHKLAVQVFGIHQLHRAVENLDIQNYRGPSRQTLMALVNSVFKYPREGSWKFTQPISPKIKALVDAISENARALGWTEASLYQNRGNIKFPCGKDWGLICFVRDGDRITSVTASAIEIVGSTANSISSSNPLKFYNPNFKQKSTQLDLFGKGGQR